MSIDSKTEKGVSPRANETQSEIDPTLSDVVVEAYVLTPEMERRVLRKTDMFILPMVRDSSNTCCVGTNGGR